MDSKGKKPTTWQDYERGYRQGSFSSTGSHVQWDEGLDSGQTTGLGSSPTRHGGTHDLRKRRSSISMRITAIGDAGGVNSFNNFARSWQRAAGFYEIAPVRASFRFSDQDGDAEEQEPVFGREQSTAAHPQSLLRAALESEGRRASDNAIEDPDVDDLQSHLAAPVEQRLEERRRSIRGESIFSVEPSLASAFGGSYGTVYGSLGSRLNQSSMRHAGRIFSEQQLKGVTAPESEREPLLVKRVEEDGHIINVVVGQSTLPQTVFNSVNVLIGVGLLSLPLAMKYSGWLIGMGFFLYSAIITQYTAKLLAKCLDVDSSLITFADLAFVSFGNKARIATSILFTLELIAACVALVILFADSLNALLPGWGVLGWKIVCGLVLVPVSFLPLRLLSFTSILGIMCCFGIVLAVFADGLAKTTAPGSLIQPAKQYIFPASWGTVPLSFGLFMSPWGGHSVFPNIYRDMRHPYKYRKGLNITYIFAYFLDVGMAVIGILMFGDDVLDEITSNVLRTEGYPEVISLFVVICIAVIPITKVPLNSRPIVSTIEILCGLDPRSLPAAETLTGMSGFNRGLLKFAIRIFVVILLVIIAIIFPSFDRIMSLMGSVACFTICVILPLAFHLKLFGKEIPPWEKTMNWVLIVVSAIMAVISTAFAFIPKEVLGA